MIDLPDPSLVLLIGPSGAGKTTFARRHFRPTEILSSDVFRAMVADDEEALDASGDAFLSLRFVALRRVRRGRLTVIDAVNLRPGTRRPFIGLARQHDLPVVAIVFDLPDPLRRERNLRHRRLLPDDLERQAADLRASLPLLGREGLAAIHVLESEEAIARFAIRRLPRPARTAPSSAPLPASQQLDLLGETAT